MERRNVIAGLLLISATILIGPYMMRGLPQEAEQVNASKELSEAFAALKVADESLQVRAVDPTPGSELDDQLIGEFAAASRRAARAHVNYAFAQYRRDNLRMTHAHGILQGMLNILAGLLISHLALGRVPRLLVSWGLIVGPVLMVGGLLVGNLWWQTALKLILPGGVILILAVFGLTLAAITANRSLPKHPLPGEGRG